VDEHDGRLRLWDPHTGKARGEIKTHARAWFGRFALTPDGKALLIVQTATGKIFRVDPDTGVATTVDLGGYVRFEGKLDHRVRVLAAMVVAREFDCMYVWGAQTGQARKQKVPESTITAIRERHSRGLPPEDAQIVDFTRDLINKHRVSDEVMSALQKRFGNYQLVELTGTIGYYSLLAMTANATELEPAEHMEVLKT